MKRFSKILFFFLSSVCALSAGALFLTMGQAVEATADVGPKSYPRNGEPGTLFYVNGNSTYFNTGEADLAVYCYNNSESAWSKKENHRLYGDLMGIPYPSIKGSTKMWSHIIICRYNPSMNPAESGFDGVYNQTDPIQVSSLMYAHNTFNINGYGEGGKLNYSVSTSDQYGIRPENHMYLDLSQFPSWENDGAKFAIYFGYPSFGDSADWSKSYTPEKNYVSSFCWKVEGQDNPHLYECIVPQIGGYSVQVWSMVIAVRYSKDAVAPGWDNKWNQTQDLGFNSGNHNANIIVVHDWGEAQFAETSISRADRVGFYGSYFLDTVKCSGTGAYDATTSAMWSAVQNEYDYHLSGPFQGDVWTTKSDQAGTLIEQAMARYDEIVFTKGYNHFDFINRVDPKSGAEHLRFDVVSVRKDDTLRIAMIVLFGVTGAGIGICLAAALKKRKSHQ